MNSKRRDIRIHIALIVIAALTLLPFVFVVNNSLRRTSEQYHSFFGMPESVKNAARFTWFKFTAQPERIQLRVADESKPLVRGRDVPVQTVGYAAAMKQSGHEMTVGYVDAW